MINRKSFTIYCIILLSFISLQSLSGIPLPEHPRPDFYRSEWINLNGEWDFQFDKQNSGESENWFDTNNTFSGKILVPFSWGAPLSGVEDEGDIGWYSREIIIPESWKGKRIFMVAGACDWYTKAWLDGHPLGENRGGYTPFELELTQLVKYGEKQKLTLRIDDTEHSFKLYGKQGYGNARGIWQTVYLEARGEVFIDHVHIKPDIDKNEVTFEGQLNGVLQGNSVVKVEINGRNDLKHQFEIPLKKKSDDFTYTYSLANPQLWTLEDPHLYNVIVMLKDSEEIIDEVNTYFGMRKISVADFPGSDYPYVTLNNKPVYLQLALDQAYHPEGFYTFPSDGFMRDEIIRSKKIGLNGQRIHVKIGIPRKLYWADKLGMLIMADVPNSWGEPDKEMRFETEKALRDMIKRDYNHPSIFSWVIFNETWGLFSKDENNKRQYLPETQEWVTKMYELAKSLDPTRLVEDNSPCNYDHVTTDLNTWHAYLPGYKWKDFLANAVEKTYAGSEWNYANGYKQDRQPMLNSECGNVWGYQGSTGDVDWSWDYHIMINEFRKQPKIAGWLYTEHHDVINEWNGYYKYDRSDKYTGLEFFNDMKLNDLHSMIQITPDMDLMTNVKPGEQVEVPLWLSVFTDDIPNKNVVIQYQLKTLNHAGISTVHHPVNHQVMELKPWQFGNIEPIQITMPEIDGIGILNIEMKTNGGNPIHRNFALFKIEEPSNKDVLTYSDNESTYKMIPFKPNSFTQAEWSAKQWDILDGLKVNGAGHGHFEYEIDIPEDITSEEIAEASFRLEMSSKQLFGKDQEDSKTMDGDYMRGRGTHDPSRNPNAYPMTDDEKYPSFVRILINNRVVNEVFLSDDPADHRGILSWHSQPKDNKLREAGSYGYLVTSIIPPEAVEEMARDKKCKIRIEVPDILPGGVAIYGKDFGLYPLDPTLVFKIR